MKSIQLWPGGTSIIFSGDPHGPDVKVHADWNDANGSPASPDELRAIKIETLAELYLEREVLVCDSSLVDDLIQAGNDEFSIENVENLRPDPSDWTLEQCKEWMDDNDKGYPDPNPWGMDRGQLLDEIGCEDEDLAAEHTEETARANLIEEINDETTDGIEEWRDVVRDEADYAEIFQWFRVTDWLADKLVTIGEPVLRNDYGEWWGRTCCGQSVMMDGTLQRVAETTLD